jgi:hypothetical protein
MIKRDHGVPSPDFANDGLWWGGTAAHPRRSTQSPATERKAGSCFPHSTEEYSQDQQRSGGARPLDVEEALPVRYCDWIGHFGCRTPDKPAIIDPASERRLAHSPACAQSPIKKRHSS